MNSDVDLHGIGGFCINGLAPEFQIKLVWLAAQELNLSSQIMDMQ